MRLLSVLLLVFAGSAATAQDRLEREAARILLHDLQPVSIRENREYCGILMRTPDGTLVASQSFAGSEAFCTVEVPEGARVVASFHTQGAYMEGYANEVPSLQDLNVMVEWGIDGYVSTPGGRFWHIDGKRGEISLICGPGCMPADTRFETGTQIALNRDPTPPTLR